MNKIVLSGNLTKDPEMRSTKAGKPMCYFTVASPRRFKNADGNYDADFIQCVAWDKYADFVNNWFKKGNAIIVEGWLKIDKFTGDDGNTRWTTQVVVDRVEFCGNKTPYQSKGSTQDTHSFELPDNNAVYDDIDNDDLPF